MATQSSGTFSSFMRNATSSWKAYDISLRCLPTPSILIVFEFANGKQSSQIGRY